MGQTGEQSALFEWSTVGLFSLLMSAASGLILYPTLTQENILTALRFSSLTTAVPFLLIFAAQPLTTFRGDIRRWFQTHHRTIWLILTMSHLIHLYHIFLYYQLGQSCPWSVWLVTLPLWLIMVSFAVVEVIQPQVFDRIFSHTASKGLTIIYRLGIWYIWFVFTLAFGLGAIANHLLFYNAPAFVLFLAGAWIYGLVWWKRVRLR